MKRVHIVGSVRSGTSLMLSCMVNGFQHDASCEHEMTVFREPEGVPRLFISKHPSDIKRIHLILRHDPNLFVIYMERDPRAVIASIHPIDPARYFADFRIWKESHKSAKKLADESRFKLVRYENLVESPDDVQRELAGHWPFLEMTDPFSTFDQKATPSFKAEEAMKGVRPISTDRIDGWKEHLPRIKAQAGRYPEMAGLLVACGYEDDDEWMKSLDGVEKDDRSSFYEDKENWLQAAERAVRYTLKVAAYKRRHPVA